MEMTSTKAEQWKQQETLRGLISEKCNIKSQMEYQVKVPLVSTQNTVKRKRKFQTWRELLKLEFTYPHPFKMLKITKMKTKNSKSAGADPNHYNVQAGI